MGTSTSQSISSDNTKNVMNAILTYMKDNIHIVDFQKLSTSTECSKYLMLLASDINKHFDSMSILPYTDSRGVLLFRKLDELAKPAESDMKERESLCLTLAYCYVRIFQIYGSLALTLIDDANYMVSNGLTRVIPKVNESRRYAYGDRRRTVTKRGGGLRGGAIELRYYSIFSSYLRTESNNHEKGYRVKYNGDATIYLLPRDNEDGNQAGKFTIDYIGSTQLYYIRSTLRKKGEVYEVKLEQPYLLDKYKTQITRDVKGLPVIKEIKLFDSKAMIGSEELSVFFNTLFKQIISGLKVYDTSSQSKNKNKNANSDADGTSSLPMKIGTIKTNLETHRPQGHCIARAMQLLSAKPIDNKDVVSYICKTKFTIDKKGKESRSGIPQKDEEITGSPGIYALAQLFYDSISNITPKIVVNTVTALGMESSMDQYVRFMKIMTARFEGKPDNKKDASEIIDKRTALFCKDEIEYNVPYTTAKEVYEIVEKLVSIQTIHAARCMKIINKLFHISTNGSQTSVTFHDDIFKKGFEYINKVNVEAREVLIDYYDKCEKTYITGMQLILQKGTRKSTASSASSASGASPASTNYITSLKQKLGTPVRP